MMRHLPRHATAVGAATLLLAACGSQTGSPESTANTEAETVAAAAADSDESEWEAVVARAEEAGIVRMYTAMLPTTMENIEAAFEKAYSDIDLEMTRIVGAEIDSTLEAEKESGAQGADIVSHVNYSWAIENLDDLVDPIGPNAASDEWIGTDYLFHDKLQMSHFTVLGMAWNTELVADDPGSYEALLDPAYAGGKIGLPEPLTPAIADMYAFFEAEFGDEFLTELAAQDPQIYSTAVPIQEALQTGEISITPWGTTSLVNPAKEAGAPVDFVVPEPGWAPPGVTYIPAWAQNADGAQVVYDFLASPEGQEAFSQDSIVPTEVADPVVSIDRITPLDMDRVTQDAWLSEYQDRWQELFGR